MRWKICLLENEDLEFLDNEDSEDDVENYIQTKHIICIARKTQEEHRSASQYIFY